MRVPRFNPRMASTKDSFSQSAQNPTIEHGSGEALRSALDELQKSEAKLRRVIDTIPRLPGTVCRMVPSSSSTSDGAITLGSRRKNPAAGDGKLSLIRKTCLR
jgi:hypothetical protein